jgi:putative RecB family exonuclease
MSAFENCPRRYAFKYVEKPPIEELQSVEAFMGSSVHETLEELYKAVQMERTPKWEETRDFYEAYWDKNWTDDIRIVRPEYSGDDYRNVGRRCLQDYFVKHFPFRETRILGIEEHIILDLDGTGKYKLQGYIDRLAEADDGTIEIHDYKTSRRLPAQEEIDRERQLALYQIGIESRWDNVQSVRLVWHYLRSGRTLVSVRTRESLDQLRTSTMQLIDTIGETTERGDFPPKESMLCDWCDYQELCPAKRHLFATAAMTPQEFSADDGVLLADRFAEANRRKADVERELKNVREQIIAFGLDQGITRIAGHNISVGINRRTDTTMPRQKTREREQLENLIWESGAWDQVSDLSRTKLPKALTGELFDTEIRAKIAAFLTPKEIITVTKKFLAREGTDDGPDIA